MTAIRVKLRERKRTKNIYTYGYDGFCQADQDISPSYMNLPGIKRPGKESSQVALEKESKKSKVIDMQLFVPTHVK